MENNNIENDLIEITKYLIELEIFKNFLMITITIGFIIYLIRKKRKKKNGQNTKTKN